MAVSPLLLSYVQTGRLGRNEVLGLLSTSRPVKTEMPPDSGEESELRRLPLHAGGAGERACAAKRERRWPLCAATHGPTARLRLHAPFPVTFAASSEAPGQSFFRIT